MLLTLSVNSIFIELSDSYRKMDPATSHVGRRRILGEHLKESVDTLEQKVRPSPLPQLPRRR